MIHRQTKKNNRLCNCILWSLILCILILGGCSQTADKSDQGTEEVVEGPVSPSVPGSEVSPSVPRSEIEVPEGRTLVVIGAWSEDFKLEKAVVNFNKENTDYWVYVMYYGGEGARHGTGSPEGKAARRRMQIELTTGNNCPDMIELESILLPVNELAQQGYLEDLTPYLEKSTVLDREDFLDTVISAYTMGDKLVALPLYFKLDCLIARQSQVQQFESWTLQDLLDYAKEYPDALLIEGDSLYNCLELLSLYEEPFVTVENGHYSVNREQIEEFLLLVNRCNEIQLPEFSYTPDKYLSNHVLLRHIWVNDFYELQYGNALMEGDVSNIGFPSEDGKGIKLSGEYTYGIPLHSVEKDGAWTFLEYYIQNTGVTEGLFSVKKADYEQLKEIQLAHEGFFPDENGVLVDSTGNAHKTRGEGEWSFSYKEVTQTDIATVEELIAHAGHPFMDIGYTAPWMDIFNDEIPAYLNGDKTLKETMDIIVSRYQLFINERH
ncbi:MAG: ABC transporter substrate-binding protein [Acetatifactor sp.]|nr:ABC transporter substrate-binding protein [Acetatifactor sp.]